MHIFARSIHIITSTLKSLSSFNLKTLWIVFEQMPHFKWWLFAYSRDFRSLFLSLMKDFLIFFSNSNSKVWKFFTIVKKCDMSFVEIKNLCIFLSFHLDFLALKLIKDFSHLNFLLFFMFLKRVIFALFCSRIKCILIEILLISDHIRSEIQKKFEKNTEFAIYS